MLTLTIIAIFLAATALFFVIGGETVWRQWAGPADLGDVELSTLRKHSRPNQALACPPDWCAEKPDIVTGSYQMSAAGLQAKMRQMLTSEPRLRKVDDGAKPLTDRYVHYSAVMKFPDTIQIDFLLLSDNTSTLAIYSRAQLGRTDFGANLARIRRWLDKLDASKSPQS